MVASTLEGEIIAELASAIPQARLVVVPECGHGSAIEQPQAVNNALRQWPTA